MNSKFAYAVSRRRVVAGVPKLEALQTRDDFRLSDSILQRGEPFIELGGCLHLKHTVSYRIRYDRCQAVVDTPISRSRLCRQPLEIQQIEFRRLAEQACQQRVDLATVVGLVIEQVRQGRRQLLLELFRR
jgi:hypothetical protein